MPRRRVVLMRISREPGTETVSQSFERDVVNALSPVIATTRYNRTWLLSRVSISDDGRYMWGKLGFQRESSETAFTYDPATQDFITVEGSGGHGTFSYYVIDLDSRYLAFEERPPDIKANSFAGAMRSLLKETHDAYFLDAEFVFDADELDRWISETDTVTRFFVSLREPNPGWDGRPENVRTLMEESHADRLTLEARSTTGESIDINDSDLRPFADLAGEGYGTVRGSGQRAGRPTYFDSERNVRTTDIQVERDEPESSIIEKVMIALRNMQL